MGIGFHNVDDLVPVQQRHIEIYNDDIGQRLSRESSTPEDAIQRFSAIAGNRDLGAIPHHPDKPLHVARIVFEKENVDGFGPHAQQVRFVSGESVSSEILSPRTLPVQTASNRDNMFPVRNFSRMKRRNSDSYRSFRYTCSYT